MTIKPDMVFTLILLVKSDKVLLGMKTKKIGKGCWNGYGGKVHDYETIEKAAVREAHEEVGVQISEKNLQLGTIATFISGDPENNPFVSEVHYFIVNKWQGDPTETADDAMITPTWFSIDDLPLEKMMSADKYYFPAMLRGEKLRVTAYYNFELTALIRPVEITKVENFKDHLDFPFK